MWGNVKRIAANTYRAQKRGGKALRHIHKREWFVKHLFMTTTHHYILFFTNKGKV
jgi:DNA gyrase subunit A